MRSRQNRLGPRPPEWAKVGPCAKSESLQAITIPERQGAGESVQIRHTWRAGGRPAPIRGLPWETIQNSKSTQTRLPATFS